MRNNLVALAAVAASMLPLAAQADVKGAQGTVGSLPFLALSSTGLTGSAPATLSGGSVLSGSQLGLTQPTADGATNYLGAGPSVGNPATLTFITPVSYVSFLWGTPDTYNTFSARTVGGTTYKFGLADLGLTAYSGSGTANFQSYVQFLATNGDQIKSITFDSAPANAFEATNFRAVATPGPIAGAGLPAIFAVAGAWFVRRRRQQAA